MIDWKECPDLERIPGKVSSQWIVVGKRIQAACVTDNAEDSTPEDMGDMFWARPDAWTAAIRAH